MGFSFGNKKPRKGGKIYAKYAGNTQNIYFSFLSSGVKLYDKIPVSLAIMSIEFIPIWVYNKATERVHPNKRKEKKMKKTNYKMMVRDSVCYGEPIYRRVWIDENGEYFVKFEGEIRNVTFAKNGFMPD